MIQQLTVTGSHYNIGLTIGQHFAEQIHKAYDGYDLLKAMRTYHLTDDGQTRYEQLLTLHQTHYPDYLNELQGIADGARRPFEDVFLMNLRGEYRGFLREADELRGCADCSVLTDALALIGHNEDGSPAFREYMYIVHAHIDGKAPFTACSYPGFLCGNAFGFNAHGICFSVDNIRPKNIRVGVARHFLARSLLDATSIADAIRRVTPSGRASGFSYTIGSIKERRIVQVEVAPEHHHVRDIRHVNFHANHILDIPEAPQNIDTSSASRVARADEILQQTTIRQSQDILQILADRERSDYPIYRTPSPTDPMQTFCTALFDLDKQEMRVYVGDPMQPETVMHFPMI